jgi:flavin-binding protein dodecin
VSFLAEAGEKRQNSGPDVDFGSVADDRLNLMSSPAPRLGTADWVLRAFSTASAILGPTPAPSPIWADAGTPGRVYAPSERGARLAGTAVHQRRERMPERTYKLIELVGVSDKDVSDAIRNAIARAGQTLRGLDWFEMTGIRGTIADGHVQQFQVTLKVGFRVMSPEELTRE